jgi:hypothetical protein
MFDFFRQLTDVKSSMALLELPTVRTRAVLDFREADRASYFGGEKCDICGG